MKKMKKILWLPRKRPRAPGLQEGGPRAPEGFRPAGGRAKGSRPPRREHPGQGSQIFLIFFIFLIFLVFLPSRKKIKKSKKIIDFFKFFWKRQKMKKMKKIIFFAFFDFFRKGKKTQKSKKMKKIKKILWLPRKRPRAPGLQEGGPRAPEGFRPAGGRAKGSRPPRREHPGQGSQIFLIFFIFLIFLVFLPFRKKSKKSIFFIDFLIFFEKAKK